MTYKISELEQSRIEFHDWCEDFGLDTTRNQFGYGCPYVDYRTFDEWELWKKERYLEE